MYIFEVMSSCSSKYGGMEKFLYELISGDKENSYIIIYDEFPESKEYLNDIINAGGKICVLDTRKMGCVVNLYTFVKLLKKYKPLIVHFHFGNTYCFWGPVSKLFGVKKLFKTVHGCIYRNGIQVSTKRELGVKQLLITYNGYIFKFFDEVVCVSEYVKNQLCHIFDKIENVTYAYLGTKDVIRLEENQLQLLRKQHNISQQTVVITSVLFAAHFKGLDILLDAISKIRSDLNFKVFLIGLDDTLPYTTQMRIKAGNIVNSEKIVWVGVVDDVYTYLNITNIYVQPSRTEALSLAAAEALSFGIPVIATNIGGLPEVASELFKLEDASELSRLISKYILDKDYRSAKSLLARKKWEDSFDISNGLSYYRNLYNKQ